MANVLFYPFGLFCLVELMKTLVENVQKVIKKFRRAFINPPENEPRIYRAIFSR